MKSGFTESLPPIGSLCFRIQLSNFPTEGCGEIGDIVYLYHYDQRYASWLGNPEGAPPADLQDTPATIRAFQAAIEELSIDFRDRRWYPER